MSTTATPIVDPMSADAPPMTLTLTQAAQVLPGYLGPVLNAAGIRAYGWAVTVDRRLPVGWLRILPNRVTITVAEEGDLELALRWAEDARQARRALRATVLEVAARSGLTDLRPFARPVGA